MNVKELMKENARKVIIAKKPILIKGFDCIPKEEINYNDLRFCKTVIVDMTDIGDYTILCKVANRCKNTLFKINSTITKFDFNKRYNDLEQFMRNKEKKMLTLLDVVNWFNKNAYKYGETAIFIESYLNEIVKSHSDLRYEYISACIAVGYDPKPFVLKETTIDDFNSRLAYVYDDKENMQYADNTIRGYYNYKDEYCEEESQIFTKKDRRLSSYNSKCKRSYNIASPEDVINVFALLYYLDPETIAPDTYKCECGHYNRYRTVQVQQDPNTGYWKSYPDTNVCCPCCGALRKEREY